MGQKQTKNAEINIPLVLFFGISLYLLVKMIGLAVDEEY